MAEVVLVSCERGEGVLRRSVLQVWSKDGDLLAEHDSIHDDPIYPAHFLRDHIDEAWLLAWAKGWYTPGSLAHEAPTPEKEAA